MGWFFCKQPNGLFAQFSTSDNAFHWLNMTEEDVMELAFEEWDIGKTTALHKLQDAKDDKPPVGPRGWVSDVQAHMRVNNLPTTPFRWQMALVLLEQSAQKGVAKQIAEAVKLGTAPVTAEKKEPSRDSLMRDLAFAESSVSPEFVTAYCAKQTAKKKWGAEVAERLFPGKQHGGE